MKHRGCMISNGLVHMTAGLTGKQLLLKLLEQREVQQ
ncbi:hypothetical protein GGC63_001248 [Paenibacillus sp. OAS669]|nr:hypothetical protein [Paenibacillus sp. OAS669]